MFQVKNKEALKMLAGRQMKTSRQRNSIAVLAIVLTTVLFSALFTVGGGILVQAQQSRMRTEVRYAKDYVAQSFMSFPTEGKMPEKKMKIATSRLVLEAMGLPDELEGEIPFSINVNGKIYDDTFTLCGVWDGDPLVPAQQAWVSEA